MIPGDCGNKHCRRVRRGLRRARRRQEYARKHHGWDCPCLSCRYWSRVLRFIVYPLCAVVAALVFFMIFLVWTAVPARSADLVGVASWYGPGFYGNTTANMEVYSGDCLTAATTALPLNVCARVTRTDDGQSIVVWLNDRGPYVEGRVIDLSRAAALHLGLLDIGVTEVLVSVVECETEKEETHDPE